MRFQKFGRIRAFCAFIHFSNVQTWDCAVDVQYTWHFLGGNINKPFEKTMHRELKYTAQKY